MGTWILILKIGLVVLLVLLVLIVILGISIAIALDRDWDSIYGEGARNHGKGGGDEHDRG